MGKLWVLEKAFRNGWGDSNSFHNPDREHICNPHMEKEVLPTPSFIRNKVHMFPQYLNLRHGSHAMIGKALKTIPRFRLCRVILGRFYSIRK